jgi:hypothetical protein
LDFVFVSLCNSPCTTTLFSSLLNRYKLVNLKTMGRTCFKRYPLQYFLQLYPIAQFTSFLREIFIQKHTKMEANTTKMEVNTEKSIKWCALNWIAEKYGRSHGYVLNHLLTDGRKLQEMDILAYCQHTSQYNIKTCQQQEITGDRYIGILSTCKPVQH